MAVAKAKPVEILWEVLAETSHGAHIHGARRARGEIFSAPESAMTFLELEGVVRRAPQNQALD